MLCYPGRITADFVHGKRIRYVPPFKLYLFVSFFYFVLLGTLVKSIVHSPMVDTVFELTKNEARLTIPISEAEFSLFKGSSEARKHQLIGSLLGLPRHKENSVSQASFRRLLAVNGHDSIRISQRSQISVNVIGNEVVQSPEKKPIIQFFVNPKYDTISIDKFKINALQLKNVFEDETVMDSIITAESRNKSFFEKPKFKNSLLFAAHLMFASKSETKAYFENRALAYLSNISYAMFFLIPFLGMFLWLFFFRRQPYFYPHLIFSVHQQTFLFGISTLALGLLALFTNYWLIYLLMSLISVGIPLYFIRSVKIVYGQSWRATFLKSSVLMILYTLLILLFSILIGYTSFLLA